MGWAASLLGLRFATPVFDGIPETEIRNYLNQASSQQKEAIGFNLIGENGKATLYDGQTGVPFDQEVVVG